MSSKLQYMEIYQPKIAKGESTEFIIGNSKVEFVVNESRTLDLVLNPNAYEVVPADKNYEFWPPSVEVPLEDEHSYLLVSSQSRLNKGLYAIKECKKKINELVTRLSVLRDPGLFANLLVEGCVQAEHLGGSSNIQFKFVERQQIDSSLEEELSTTIRTPSEEKWGSPDIRKRFLLMSEFYSKSLRYPMSPERFLFLWTTLEIFPMKDTSDIKPLNEYLGAIVNCNPETVRDQIGTGRLYGMRCDLVHNGEFYTLSEDLNPLVEDAFKRLNVIVEVILGSLIGEDYDGLLDEFY